ncbi:MAG: anion permease, partial [Deltaproteobacteria bacterium]|nr:anion permease [Deltaproteobacteria bacterium]
MVFKSKGFMLCVAFGLGIIVLLLPRPEGTKFQIVGDDHQKLFQSIHQHFNMASTGEKHTQGYIVEMKNPNDLKSQASFILNKAAELGLKGVELNYINGLSPKAKRFLAVLTVLVFLFVVEPIPLEITAICIGVFMVIMGITDVKNAWAPYMHPVVVFIMCCLIFAISLEKANLTKRLGYFIIKKAGTSVIRFTFILSIGLGISSAFM